ncbi:MAG: FUSC family protein [Alphaproteobacteria bacterium]|nr:FUSC family protein [Alphaproteobacteria bacterium]
MKAIFGQPSQHGPETTRFRWLGELWSRNRLEIRHGLRIAAGGLASYAAGHLLGLPQAYWAVFTAVLVVQGSVGGSWKASTDRFVGTLFGAAYGAAVATLMPHDNAFTLGVALAVSLLPLALLSAFYPAFRVAPITAIILLLGSTGAAEGPIRAALLRTLEVALGGVFGMAVSLFLFPARAHMLLGRAAQKVLQRLSELFPDLIAAISEHSSPDPPTHKASAGELGTTLSAGALAKAEQLLTKQDRVRAALNELESVVTEAARERRNHLSEDVDPEPIARTLRRVRHDLVLIGRIAAEPVIANPSAAAQNCLRQFRVTGSAYLAALGDAFAGRHVPPPETNLDPAIEQLLTVLEQMEPGERIVALRFYLQQLRRNLFDLHQRAGEFAAASAGRGAAAQPAKN